MKQSWIVGAAASIAVLGGITLVAVARDSDPKQDAKAAVEERRLQWYPATGNASCSTVCINAQRNVVASGVYTNNKPFYVCRADAHSEGKRAGYNLDPNWRDACVVGWGGKEESIRPYECACE